MHNIVSLEPDRPRPQRALAVPRSGARILFFTGVRYCRDGAGASCPAGPAFADSAGHDPSRHGFDATAH